MMLLRAVPATVPRGRGPTTKPDLIDRLADPTAHRERDVLDAAQVPALKDLVQPLSVAISTGRPATTAGRPG
jgi:hypothetical protein